ncbi:thiopeptide-type bacteriocin biosynthesis protein [Methylobacterium oryzisoli]|uniref:thiopeptide-type bacteriocin biosynthesis protein n=1 Tax=Methylobacterium oryzisoli TaxID=3385502 RepID=UPI003892BFC7
MSARPAREWVQLNVGLARSDGSALPAARALLRGLADDLPALRRDRLVTRFVFQRKPPDLRLRFRAPRAALIPRLRPFLAQLAAEGHVTARFWSVYEPEIRQFGGREAMACVHAHWEADGLAWIARDRLAEAGAARIATPLLLTALLNDLFWRTLGDGPEVWDTWCNLAAILGDEAEEADPGAPPGLDTLAPAGAAEAALLDGYARANAALAQGLLRTWSRGRLTGGLRTILPFVALFTLNRHGLGQPEAAALTRTMRAAWDPRQALRGAAPDDRPRARAV